MEEMPLSKVRFTFWANDLKLDFADPLSPIVATEFVGTSVSSHPPPYEALAKAIPDNPHVKFFESRMRGYASVELTGAAMTTRFRDRHAVVVARGPGYKIDLRIVRPYIRNFKPVLVAVAGAAGA